MSTSPSRTSRLQEKEELKGLNSRLVTYIGRVKQLKEENHKLLAEVTTSKEVTVKEVDGIKEMYETELSDARKILDQTAKDKAREQLAASKYAAELEEMKEKLAAEKAKRERAESATEAAERTIANKETAIQTLIKDKQKVLAKNDELVQENEALSQALAETKKALEDETLKRVDLENANQSLVEDLAFKQELHKQEVAELKEKIQTINTTTVTLETDFQREYDDRLGRALEEMKDKFEREADQYRTDVENTYKDQISNLKDQLKEESNSTTIYHTEIQNLKQNINEANKKIDELEAQNAALARRVQQLEDQLRREREQNAEQVERLRNLLRDTRDELSRKIAEYEDLLDTKLSLDFEIMTYKKLLEEEEDRLQLSPKAKEPGTSGGSDPTASPSSTDGPSAKKAKLAKAGGDTSDEDMVTTTSISNSGDGIVIVVADASGKFIKIANMTDQDEKFAGWKIHRVANRKNLTYKFPARYTLRSQSSVTVWTGKHQSKPPTDLVFKGKDSWGVGTETETQLLNPDGKVVATVTTAPGREDQSVDPGDGNTIELTTRKTFSPARDQPRDTNQGCVIS